ncbi:hypothetical protein V6N13_092223 [Hibiscus sabdariffa]|uniref:Uncharacterized protein n=1 Tax=Hibiscus sabdariffa TaxID=183260 RepID=A0ABR2CC67_9ROSI
MKEVQLTSVSSASAITSKLKDIAQQLKFKIKKEVGGLSKIEKSNRGRKGTLAIDTKIFEFTPSWTLFGLGNNKSSKLPPCRRFSSLFAGFDLKGSSGVYVLVWMFKASAFIRLLVLQFNYV